MEEPVVHRNRIQGGVPVFAATRVPVKNLFDYLEAGDTIDQFLIDFPAVDRAKAIARWHGKLWTCIESCSMNRYQGG